MIYLVVFFTILIYHFLLASTGARTHTHISMFSVWKVSQA